MSSHTLSHQPIANWIFQRAEIKSRSPAPPSVAQSPTTKPIISSEIFGSNSQSVNSLGKFLRTLEGESFGNLPSFHQLGKRASSEIQLPHNSFEHEANQDRRRTLSVSGKKRCSNCGDELGLSSNILTTIQC